MLDVDDEEDNDDDKEKDKQEETKEEIDATVDDSSHSSEGELTRAIRKASKEKAQEDKKRGITQSNLEFNAWVELERLVKMGKLDSLLPYPIDPAEDNRTTISDLTSIVVHDPPARENESGVPVTHDTVGSSEGERIVSMDTVGQFGRDGIVISQEELIERRRRNGECPTCGQKCFKKKLFKWVPLTIEGRVRRGRCLLCTNNDGRNESDMDDDDDGDDMDDDGDGDDMNNDEDDNGYDTSNNRDSEKDGNITDDDMDENNYQGGAGARLEFSAANEYDQQISELRAILPGEFVQKLYPLVTVIHSYSCALVSINFSF